MKKLILILAISILSIHSYPQIVFEKGYLINDNNERVECFIKNVDWKNNPSDFEYKRSDTSKTETAGIQSVKEFGIGNTSKYVRVVVKIDRSSEDLTKVSSDRNPLFKEEVLFLNVLVEGKASLFLFEERNLTRFFYRTNDPEIKQLVYKIYLIDNQRIGDNNQFRQQLFTDLKCQGISMNDVETLNYNKKELVRFFIRYNECQNSNHIVFEGPDRKDFFNLALRPGLNISSLSIENSISDAEDTDFDRELNFRFGLEAEFILPFNNSKWAIIIEPTYQYYKTQKESDHQNVEVDYQSIELPFGIRHYFHFHENSKIFVNASFVFDLSIHSTIIHDSGWEQEIYTLNNYAIGLGYEFHDRFSLEARYMTSRNVLVGYTFWDSDFKTLSVIFGYSIF